MLGPDDLIRAPEQTYQQLRPLLRSFPACYRLRHRIKPYRIEHERAGRADRVADTFTVADLTAAALLSPLLQPPEIQYPLQVELPAYVQAYRATLLQHPATQWAAGIYRQHRGRSAEISRSSQQRTAG
jgi:hypothetical protein